MLFIPVLAAAALAAAASDVRTRRIPNVLCGALAVGGVVTSGIERGLLGVGTALALLAAILAVGTFVFARGWFGGGDIKLLAAGCCGLTPVLAADFLLYTSLCGGLLALSTFASPQRMAALLITRTYVPTGQRLPYAVAIAGGSLFLWVAMLCPALFVVR